MNTYSFLILAEGSGDREVIVPYKNSKDWNEDFLKCDSQGRRWIYDEPAQLLEAGSSGIQDL